MEMEEIVGVGLESYASGLLVGSSGFVGFDLRPESMFVGNVVDLTVDALVVNESVASFDVSVSVTGFLSVLFAMVVFHVVAEVIGLWFMKLKVRRKSFITKYVKG